MSKITRGFSPVKNLKDITQERSSQDSRATSSSAEMSARGRAPEKLKSYPKLTLDATKMERGRILPYIQDNGAVNSYKVLRTRVLQRMRSQQWNSLMVTGTLPADGKTTTAINLAIGLCQNVGQAVTLVDLDMQRPSIAKCLGLKRSAGLSDYLLGNAGMDDILYNTDIRRLAIVPNFQAITSTDFFISPKMLKLAEHLQVIDPDRLIIFDMPPALASDAVLAFAPHVDAALLVATEGVTNRSSVQRTTELLDGLPWVGTVLNQASEGGSGYDY